ncbi:UNVERIFIED_CONTAM: hypothetical protein RMT77_019902 [Armadillidium vulgare]
MFFLRKQLTTDAEIIKSGKELGLKGKELIDFFKESQTRAAAEAEKARAEARAEAEKARAEAAKQRDLEYRLLKIKLGLVSEFDDSIEESHSEKNKSVDGERKLEEKKELKIELVDPKQEIAVLPFASRSGFSQQITSSRESPMKEENVFSQHEVFDERETPSFPYFFSQPETLAEREVTPSRDMSSSPKLSEQKKNEDEVSSYSSEVEHSGTQIPKWVRVDTRGTEERDCYGEITISPGKESQIERPRVALTDNMEKIDSFVSSDKQGLENTPVEGEKNKIAVKCCFKPNVQAKLEESMLEGEASDNSAPPSDNDKQMKEMVVIKSEVKDSSR